jgi:hypothetical protein
MARRFHKRKFGSLGLLTQTRSQHILAARNRVSKARTYIGQIKSKLDAKACKPAIEDLVELFNLARGAEAHSEMAKTYVAGIGEVSDKAEKLMAVFKRICLVKVTLK